MVQSEPPRRYFDNAATSFPKPPGVIQAVRDYMERIGASAGRGAYREAIESEQLLSRSRSALRKFFGCQPDDHVVFTLNGSDALNLAIKSIIRPGDHVITSTMDHNSVLRPLNALASQIGITWTAAPVDPVSTILDMKAFAGAFRENTRLVAINHASNVTGVLQPLDRIARICRERGVTLLVDAAQSAGHVPIRFSELPIDLLACPGHKGLMGPLGTGVLVIRNGVEAVMRTVREGGTGSESELPTQPERMPDKFEAGSHNAVGLAGLLASVSWVLDQGIERLREHERALCERMARRLDDCPGLRWFGPRESESRVGVFSVRLDGVEPAELSTILEQKFGVLTRSGLHCAPLAHETIGTIHSGGTTRFSLGAFLREADVDAAVEALTALARDLAPAGND